MYKLSDIFPVKKPIIAMVHVQYNPKTGMQEAIDRAMLDVERLERGGVDGLLFENWGVEYTDIYATGDELGCLYSAMATARRTTKLPYGVNTLPLDYGADAFLADTCGARFVQLDTFVDRVRTDYKKQFVIRPNPKELRKILDEYALFVNIQTKHYQILPPNKRLETSARQAIERGADALVVTGVLTGKRTPRKKISRVKQIAELHGVSVWIGSGLNLCNIDDLRHADGAIMGTGLKIDGVTENPVDGDKTKRVMKAVHKLR